VLFLFDEPLSNLDARLRIELREEFIRLHRRLRKTVMYVTHDQVEAQVLGEKIVVMDKGEIQQVAGPRTLYEHPANLFVAQFIGTPPMNLLQMKLEDSGRTLARGELRIPVPVGHRLEMGKLGGAGLYLGFRPSGCRVDPSAGMKGEVEFVENVGEDSYARVRLVSGDQVTVKLDGQGPHAGQVPNAGEHTAISLIPEKLYFFTMDGKMI
jgi:ABC-type sugar transport system ATPase subunit